MNNAEIQLRGLSDPRLAAYATSALPAWFWSADGTRIWWANPVGARLFGAANGAVLASKTFGPADSHRRQIAQLAGRLPPNGAIRMERLRGFGAPLGTLVTCACARLEFADGSHGVLVTAAEPVGRAMPLVERLRRLVEGIDAPVASFARDGLLIGTSEAARSLPGFDNLVEAGLAQARDEALSRGRAEMPFGIGHVVLQRVGSGADIALVALIAPGANAAPHIDHPAPDHTAPNHPLPAAAAPQEPAPPIAPLPNPPAADYEQPALSGEAPAEFALVDEFAEEPEKALESVAMTPPPELAGVEAPHGEPAPQTAAPEFEPDREPSPEVEAVADEPPQPTGEPAPDARRHPLRFTWQMDAEGRFSLGTEEFTHLIGTRTASGFGRPWDEIATAFGLDPDGRVLKAIATRATWSGITLQWPADGGERLPVELSGLPVYDGDQNFAGFRGFGVCRDLEALTRLAALRQHEFFNEHPTPTQSVDGVAANGLPADDAKAPAAAELPPVPPLEASTTPARPHLTAVEPPHPTDLETAVEPPKNVLPFRPIGEPKAPVLTPVENHAFDELARQLAARLDNEPLATATPPVATDARDQAFEPPATAEPPKPGNEKPANEKTANEKPDWLAHPEPPARGESRRDRALLDLVPVGVLIYRLDRLLYANRAFLERMGHASLHALEEAGGLDALYVEPGVSTTSSTSDTGTPVTISAGPAALGHAPPRAAEARLFTISWDGETALALIFASAGAEQAVAAAIAAPQPSAVGHANAEDLGAILDTSAEGIVMFDAGGQLNSCNRGAEALFGYDGADIVRRNLTELFAPESQRAVRDYLEAIKGPGAASLLDRGCEALGRAPGGDLIPLSVKIGRTRADGPNFFAVFRDLSQTKKTEVELQQARRLADRAANAKADMLARISHEVRTPLNAIIGFAEVMIAERFGALGNERYVEYMKDIRASGERVVAIINDLTDLSRIETGKLDLDFASQNLNDLVEQCVAVMQPQANRERIIIRTSLAHMLPPVVADARALRQIALNLIGNSIHLANPGGQVIVSTALSDFGEVVLRVRDTGHGLNDNEVAAAMEPFRTPPPSDQASDSSGVSLSLTKALVEANHAQFHIRTGPLSGTLIEVVFAHGFARAQ